MYLCACNMCGSILHDLNPASDALDYPDVLSVGSLIWLPDEEGQGEFLGCPICGTDGYLFDDSVALHAKYHENRPMIEAAIVECESLPEYQEEDSTGWESLQHLKLLLV